jgi:DNA primase
VNSALQEWFSDLVHRHLPEFTPRNGRGVVLCVFHQEKTPSLSIDLEKGVFHCFGCGVSGGVKDFAQLVGETWGSTRSESHTAKARRARFQAEQQARAILQQRAEERDKALCVEYRELYGQALSCVDLLSLFRRRPDLAEEFSDVLVETRQEYGAVLFKLCLLEARLDGEVVA